MKAEKLKNQKLEMVKSKQNFDFSLKWIVIPVLFATIMRFVPGYFYGNTRVYDSPIPYEVKTRN